ncbi:MAG TPA: methionyl-tRNA formyltransferase [Opitutaceae bacterium]|nr:methionyl-tRNA formyltransferase [Opitutaceae bacterium]
MAETLRIVFLGSDAIALPGLDWLERNGSDIGRIVGVFTQPDRASGRGQRPAPNAVKQWAVHRSIPVFQPERLDAEARAQLQALNADVSLVMAYGHILKDDFITTPRLGTLNLHASLLPRYRGASPIQTAISQGDKETGISLMRIVRALDAGPVARMTKVRIEELDTAAEIETKLASVCGPLLGASLPQLADGTLEFVEQDHTAASYCRRLAKADGRLDFTRPGVEIAARIRGLFPWPGCTVEIGGVIIKVGLADATRETAHSMAPGTVLGANEAGLCIAAGEGVVRLLKLQRPGGRMLSAGEFLRGFPIAVGLVARSHPMPVLVASRPFPFRSSAP